MLEKKTNIFYLRLLKPKIVTVKNAVRKLIEYGENIIESYIKEDLFRSKDNSGRASSMNSPQEILQELIDHEAYVKYFIQWSDEPKAERPAFTLHRWDIGAVNNKWTLRSIIGICETFPSRTKAEERLKQIHSTAKEKHGKIWQLQGKKWKVFCEN